MKLIEELRIATLTYMVRRNLTQQDMARKLNVTQPCIRAWCFEDRNVLSEDVLERLVLALRAAGILQPRVSIESVLTVARQAIAAPDARGSAANRRLSELVSQHSIKTKPVRAKGTT